MRIKVVFILVIMLGCLQGMSYLHAEKLAVLNEVLRPERFAIGNGYIYVLENTTIHIYDLKTYKYFGKFGKEGEGPKEIKKNTFGAPIGLTTFKDKVFITSSAKVSIFSKTGKYIKEYRVKQFDTFYPFADRYICMGQAFTDGNKKAKVLAIFLADKKLQKGKILYKSNFEVGMNFKWDFPITPFYPMMKNDKLFIIAGKDGFAINIYDKKGNKTGRIFKDVKKLKIPSEYKKKTIAWFKGNSNYNKFWSFFKNKISFKNYYPQIYSAFAGKNRLYVFTNVIKGTNRECIVMDFKGKEIKRLFLFSPETYGLDFNFKASINENYYYWIIENDKDETWELFRKKIE